MLSYNLLLLIKTHFNNYNYQGVYIKNAVQHECWTAE